MKAFKCPECTEVSSSADWNNQTERHFAPTSCDIENEGMDSFYYACPKCLCRVDGEDILESGII